jgi:hypothetical protein
MEIHVNSSALETYLLGVDGSAVPVVVSLDKAVRSAYPKFDVAIKYKILMYALHGDFRTWVCAIDAKRSSVALRFLYGVLLDDPRRVLRAGTSVLKTWDFALDAVIDATAVGPYVAEAVARYDEYRANTIKVLNASRAAGRHKKPDAGK